MPEDNTDDDSFSACSIDTTEGEITDEKAPVPKHRNPTTVPLPTTTVRI